MLLIIYILSTFGQVMLHEDGCCDDVQALTGLGLTSRQAKIYLILSQMEKASINTLCLRSKIDRANVYRTMKQLEDLKIVEKLATSPTTFKASPINEGMFLLLERQKSEFINNEAKAKLLLEKYPNGHTSVTCEKGANFAIVPSGKLAYNEIIERIESSHKTHQAIVYWKDFECMPDIIAFVWKKLLLRGVEITVLVFSESDKQLPKRFEEFRTFGKIEVRITTKRPKTTFAIYDGKTALLSTLPMIYDSMNAYLLMENVALVGLLQEYFELMWHDSKPILK